MMKVMATTVLGLKSSQFSVVVVVTVVLVVVIIVVIVVVFAGTAELSVVHEFQLSWALP